MLTTEQERAIRKMSAWELAEYVAHGGELPAGNLPARFEAEAYRRTVLSERTARADTIGMERQQTKLTRRVSRAG